ncbi:membrane protein insertion efficiency factor YidD [Helicobacter suis]|uniref:membrane protein insertion efficiency factor YidD n=1 Tax=Helicobacter suis TaxID=104628 RepID=UPI0013D7BCDA|nr:membrane protein insertion efficiency factor YidD [Helicobacter suis]
MSIPQNKTACYEACVRLVLALLQFYRKYLSLLKPTSCRFYPTCSTYALWLLHNEGLFKALLKICRRLLSCHPYCKGGIDYPIGSKHITPKYCSPQEIKLRYYLVPLKPPAFSPYYILKASCERK